MRTLYESILDNDQTVVNKVHSAASLRPFVEWMRNNTYSDVNTKNGCILISADFNPIEQVIDSLAPYVTFKGNNVIFSDELTRFNINCGSNNTKGTLRDCPYTITWMNKKESIHVYFDTYDFTGIELGKIFKSPVYLIVDDVAGSKGITNKTFKDLHCVRLRYGAGNRTYKYPVIKDYGVFPEDCQYLELCRCTLQGEGKIESKTRIVSICEVTCKDLNWLPKSIVRLQFLDYEEPELIDELASVAKSYSKSKKAQKRIEYIQKTYGIKQVTIG